MESEALDHIADAYWSTGDRERTGAAWEAAATIVDDLADPRAAELRIRLREREAGDGDRTRATGREGRSSTGSGPATGIDS
jgi:hypothetical protein